MGRVEGKVAIISGGASGLGAASARMLAREGARVIIADLDVENGQKVASDIGPVACFKTLDVTEELQWAAVVEEAMTLWGRLDILVNCAGIVIRGSVEDLTLEQFRRVNAVNLEGTFLGCKAAFPALKKSGGGSIINLSSVASFIGTPPDIIAYSASKGGVEALTRSIAVHCLSNRLNIRCNSLHPGNIRTPMLINAVECEVGPDALEETLAKMAEVQPMGVPDDVAYMVLYLASDESQFINGTQMVLDRGYTVS